MVFQHFKCEVQNYIADTKQTDAAYVMVDYTI